MYNRLAKIVGAPTSSKSNNAPGNPSPTSDNDSDSDCGVPAAPVPTLDPNLCEVCQARPKYVAGGRTHAYCGRTCAAQAVPQHARAPPPPPPPPSLALPLLAPPPARSGTWSSWSSTSNKPSRSQSTRAAPGSSSAYNAKPCKMCQTNPRNPPHDFCSRQCGINYLRGGSSVAPARNLGVVAPTTPGPTHLQLEEKALQTSQGQLIAAAFIDMWSDRSGVRPTVGRIFMMNFPRAAHVAFDANRQKLTKSDRLVTLTTFFGAQCVCDIGAQPGPPQLCKIASCDICTVITHRFEAFGFGDTSLTGSRGPGIYTHRNSAKADIHATSTTTSPYRCMILADIDLDSKKLDKNLDPHTRGIYLDSAVAIMPRALVLYTKSPPDYPTHH